MPVYVGVSLLLCWKLCLKKRPCRHSRTTSPVASRKPSVTYTIVQIVGDTLPSWECQLFNDVPWRTTFVFPRKNQHFRKRKSSFSTGKTNISDTVSFTGQPVLTHLQIAHDIMHVAEEHPALMIPITHLQPFPFFFPIYIQSRALQNAHDTETLRKTFNIFPSRKTFISPTKHKRFRKRQPFKIIIFHRENQHFRYRRRYRTARPHIYPTPHPNHPHPPFLRFIYNARGEGGGTPLFTVVVEIRFASVLDERSADR